MGSRERFLWGVATSAYQIEGAVDEDGKGESIWDRFVTDGRTVDDGLIACDHYHRLDEDLDLLADLGVNSYRFSVSWPRVIPDGSGEINEDGIRFYERLIDGLRERDIEPWLTLYHWDLPQLLQDRRGWASRETAVHFARYARIMVDRLGDRVEGWITHNEPWVATYLGHLYDVFAPGLSDWATSLRVAHHLLVSHGMAIEELRSGGARRVGIALDCRPVRKVGETDEEREAARVFDGFRNRWFFDPVFGRGYPEDVIGRFETEGRIPAWPPDFVRDGDLNLVAAPIDFLALNYYTTTRAAPGAEEQDDPEGPVGADPPADFTEMGWLIDPGGLRDYLIHIDEAYSPPEIIISENGASYSDSPSSDGTVPDHRRIDYLRSHIDAVFEARDAGVPVSGYFVWSFMDNVEWTSGFSQRFGLVWVDQESLDRLPKASFDWYRGVISG